MQMVRRHLEALPTFPLPAGYALRMFERGDAATWARLVQAADLHQAVSADRHREVFGEDLDTLRQRQFFLTAPGGEAVGTATAWYGSGGWERDWGRVHWVAIRPDCQGRGLSKPLLHAVLERLRRLGHRRAYLITETVRRAALRLYLRFGFEPDLRRAEDRSVWMDLRRAGLPVALPDCAFEPMR
ncbi:MAG: GNAT family N-acetyltransferase [Verrucomicrobiales bacterium]|nr:GNAT family N-acetyltransferase [Verrucomicrobiales bacterium]